MIFVYIKYFGYYERNRSEDFIIPSHGRGALGCALAGRGLCVIKADKSVDETPPYTLPGV
jgi:hypothetical protein